MLDKPTSSRCWRSSIKSCKAQRRCNAGIQTELVCNEHCFFINHERKQTGNIFSCSLLFPYTSTYINLSKQKSIQWFQQQRHLYPYLTRILIIKWCSKSFIRCISHREYANLSITEVTSLVHYHTRQARVFYYSHWILKYKLRGVWSIPLPCMA